MRTEDGTYRPLAIVGVGCRLPGGGDSAEAFWDLLCTETDATRVVPETRWNAARFYDPSPSKVGKIVTQRGGFLDQIDQFDPQFFGISPREAHSLDPQQRLLLHATWEALEDGGIPPDTLAGTDVGVFVGGFTLDYQLLQNQGRTSRYRFKAHSATGMMMTMLANRISHAFDFRGPSMTIDTACSSSLVAVHLAAQSIWNGECDLAVAGGVNIMIGPNTAIAESKSGFLSPEGRSKAFDDSADGYARGEGGAVVVIKPLDDALRDRDAIYAQILGTAVSQDGRTDGITVPRGEAQEAAIITALRRAGVQPEKVGYVEAHGTGTPVGDPIEMRALAAAFTADRHPDDPLLIGSVKTNIGHLEAGAGVAGLIKAALVLKHGYIPANLHLRNPTRHVSLWDLKIDVPRTGTRFPDCDRRIAGVNSFGFGGTNAHVVLAEPPAASAHTATPEPASATPTVLPISARSEEALVATAGRLADHLDRHPQTALHDLAYTLGERRAHLGYRHTLIAESTTDAQEQLQALADGGAFSSGRTVNTAPRLAFVCTGMGPQWWGMCRDLLDVFPCFSDSIMRSDRELARYTGWSLIDELRRDENHSRMGETEIAQPANFAIQVALAEQLAAFGITPDAVVGHSAGEVAAHHLAGLLTFEQAVHVIYHRSRLQQRTSGLGGMLAVGLDADTLMQTVDTEAREAFGDRVSVAAINSPTAVTIAGDSETLDDIARQLDDAAVFNRRLPVKVPYHTHYMEEIRNELFDAFSGLSSKSAQTPLYSTVTGEELDGYQAGAAYWWQNTRATVLFEPAIRRMLDDGYTHFVELGPHPVLAASIFETAGKQKVSVTATQRRSHDDVRTLLNSVGALHCQGRDVSWRAINPHGGSLLKLPSYPWQTKRFWNETHEAVEALFYNPVHPLLGQSVRGVHPTWEVEVSTVLNAFLADHRVQGSVVIPGAVYVEMALAAAEATYGSSHSVDNLVLHRAVILDDTCDPILRTTLSEADATLEFAAFTAAADGESKWTITATAELNIRPAAPHPRDPDSGMEPITSVGGDDFYSRTEAIGFDYGGAFRSVRSVTAGEDWATADIGIPEMIVDEIGQYHFHPALIDGAFQTLFGAPFLGQEKTEEPYLPTRIRHCAVYGAPENHMRVQVRVVSATAEAVESDITITDRTGRPLAVFDGFSVQSLNASSRMSRERIDKGLYEIQWCEVEDGTESEQHASGGTCWLVLTDDSGVGDAVADELRRHGHHVTTLGHRSDVDLLPQLDAAGDLAGIVDCWPLDMPSSDIEESYRLGVYAVLRLVKGLTERTDLRPKLFIATANAQAAPGTKEIAAEQATMWGLGRVLGHQEFPEYWGGLLDVDPGNDPTETGVRICRHLLEGGPEDQIAVRGDSTYVARLRPCHGLTRPFPTKLTADATYVVTGGAGALGRVVTTYLAERGARHIAVLNRRALPPRGEWPDLTEDHPHHAMVNTIQAAERIGVHVTTAAVDIAEIEQMTEWLDRHTRDGGRPVRGIIHAAGVVDDQLIVNTSEADFAKVLAPKVIGTRVLHEVFRDHELEFFVMFGSAGSTIASPGQGNYAAANAFMDAFALHRRVQGLPALSIGWGPWSVGMVEDLNLEKVYAQRGIELITPAVGTRILDRLINQAPANVVAITADWGRARHAGLGGRLPRMFSELDTAEAPVDAGVATGSILEALAVTPETDRRAVIAKHVGDVVAAVFDCAVADFEFDDMLDDIGLDSMMAMDFRARINAIFSIDLPVLEILRGVSVNSLTDRILAELHASHGVVPADGTDPPPPVEVEDEVDRLMAELTDVELAELLAELEAEPETGGGHP